MFFEISFHDLFLAIRLLRPQKVLQKKKKKKKKNSLRNTKKNSLGEGLIGLVGRHINHCGLFSAKSYLYIYINHIHDL